jgi:hypothetical protein
MNDTSKTTHRLREMVSGYNRDVRLEVLFKSLLGLGFSVLVFGFVFWLAWFTGLFFTASLHLHAWQFAILVAGLFLIVATWSAWKQVDPLAGLQPLTDQQRLLTLISQATPGVVYFSPRHATAGAAAVLLAGPANILEALGIWVWRLRLDPMLLEEAARLLNACNANYRIEEIREPEAALLLKRLALVKLVPLDDSSALTLTEKGEKIVKGGKARDRKRSRAPEISNNTDE